MKSLSMVKQLKLLLWKNFILHWRQKIRVILEIIWPLFLFLILMWVRSRGLKYNAHQCIFDEKAMPSAGIFPFIQNTLCTFNNTCHPSVTNEDARSRIIGLNSTLFLNVIEELEDIINTHINDETISNLRDLSVDWETLSLFVKQLTDPEVPMAGSINISSLFKDSIAFKENLRIEHISLMQDSIETILHGQIPITGIQKMFGRGDLELPTYLCTANGLQHLLIFQKSKSDAIYKELCSLPQMDYSKLALQVAKELNLTSLFMQLSTITANNTGRTLQLEKWQNLVTTANNIFIELQYLDSFTNLIDNLNKTWKRVKDAFSSKDENRTTQLIQIFMCGRNISTFFDPDKRGPARHFEEFRQQMKNEREKFIRKDDFKYAYDNTTTPKCNALFKTLELNQLTRMIWNQVKPFVRGKIIYYPNSTAAHKIIAGVNDSFVPLLTALNFTNYWLHTWGPIVNETLQNGTEHLQFLKNVTTPESVSLFQLIEAFTNDTSMSKLGNETLLSAFETLHWASVNFLDHWEDWLHFVHTVIEEARDYLQCFETDRFEVVDKEDDIVHRGLELIRDNKLWAGLVFSNLKGRNSLPPFVKYKIRMAANKVDTTKKLEARISRPGPRRRPGLELKYLTFGFAYLQDMIEHAIIKEQTGHKVNTGIYMQQFPYPCYIFDQFILALSRTFPLFMVLSWVYTSSMIIKSVVYEKEQRLKEVMKVMGLGNGVLWLAWFIKSFLMMAVSSVLLMLVLVYGNVMENSDPGVIYVFLLCYSASTIMQAFFFSTLFSRANVAAAAGGIIFFVTYIPYPFLFIWEEKLSLISKVGASLLSNVAFGFGCSYIAHYEEEGVGAQWSNILKSPIPGDQYSMFQVMMMLLIDGAIYGVIMWYIEGVWPGQYGVPKPWYFPFTKSYWCGTAVADPLWNLEGGHRNNPHNGAPDFEEEPHDLPLGVSIHKLTKIYDNQKLAVDDLSLNFYEGQITSFLGHNGAGKTTTISIVTGMFPPTSGTTKIYGLDIRKDMDIIRRNLGTCPQHNVLFDDLTVMEHLWFYGQLKGSTSEAVTRESQQMIEDIGLYHKKDELSRNLSGGMQRKLSIAIAFVGGSKTVILDEPTAGVDPYARRSIWELLLKYKTGRTVILTTHHMDEADLLGDRIAVIANGKLRCCGSSLFLKTRFGNGYYLTLVKAGDYCISAQEKRNSKGSSNGLRDISTKGSSEVTDEGVADMSTLDSKSDRSDSNGISDSALTPSSVTPWSGMCITSKVTEFIKSYVPEATLVEDVGAELSYLLPTLSQRTGALEKLFGALDSHLEELHITSYGIADTSLEEVFLKVTGAVSDPNKSLSVMNGGVISAEEGECLTSQSETPRRKMFSFCQTLKNLKLHRMRALLKKEKQEDRNVPLTNLDDPAARERLTEGAAGHKERSTSVSGCDGHIPTDLPSLTAATAKRFVGLKLFQRQLFALHIRRFHHTRRNYKGMLCEIVLPAMFVCLALALALTIPPLVEEPAMEMTPWLYGPPNYVFYSNDDPKNPLTHRYIDTLVSETGMGTRCVKDYNLMDLPCEPRPMNKSYLLPKYPVSKYEDLPSCTCGVGSMRCPAGASGPQPAMIKLSTSDYLMNMTGRNITDWLLKTRKQYYKQRYGGFTFGFKNPVSKINFTLIHHMVEKIRSKWLSSEQLSEIHSLLMKTEDHLRTLEMFDNVKVWFNNIGWASSVSYMNALNNALLRMHLPPGTDSRYYGISVTNHPMNFTQDQLQDEVLERKGISLVHAVCIIFAMSFVTASFVMLLIEDRVTGSKHLQFVSGVKPVVYWIGTYTWDLCNFLIPFFLVLIIFLVFKEDAYVSKENITGFALLLLLYGWASIPLMYPISYLFSIPSSAFVALACLNLFIGIVTTLSTYILELFTDQELQDIAAILRKVFLIFPHYCLGRGLMDLFTNQLSSETLAKFGINMFRDPLGWNFLGRNLVFLAIQGISFFTITLLVEYQFFIRNRWKANLRPISEVEEEDVAMERSKVLGGHANNAVLRVENLTKVYKPGQNPAVNHLCVAVQPGECFGLLGVNGAGKTTTFKMLTGNTPITSGNAYISGYSVTSEIDQVRQSIGYCPQFDALDPLLTGYEHLEFYARLRGIPEKYVKKIAQWGIRKLGLLAYGHYCAGTYSGGNKRKLSTAIALVGNPSIVFLDEPTTGMDPKARRFLWNCIIDVVKEGRSVILTSHSMEECEALCTRLAIMVNGQFRCLGSIQHLKNKYGEGYTLTLKVGGSEEAVQEVAEFMEKAFGSLSVLQEQHLNQMEYQLSPSLSLATVFKELEKARSFLNIEDYSVSQTTLDQVFISFAKMQADICEELPTDTLPQQVLRNNRTGCKRNKESSSGVPGIGDIELLVQPSYSPTSNNSPVHV